MELLVLLVVVGLVLYLLKSLPIDERIRNVIVVIVILVVIVWLLGSIGLLSSPGWGRLNFR